MVEPLIEVVRVHNAIMHTEATYIGRGTPLGNPWTHIRGQGKTIAKYVVPTKDEALEKFKARMDRVLLGDESILSGEDKGFRYALFALYRDVCDATKRMRKYYLVCHCAPSKCHGDFIREWLLDQWTRDQFKEHDVVELACPKVFDRSFIPVGTMGTIVSCYKDNMSFAVELNDVDVNGVIESCWVETFEWNQIIKR